MVIWARVLGLVGPGKHARKKWEKKSQPKYKSKETGFGRTKPNVRAALVVYNCHTKTDLQITTNAIKGRGIFDAKQDFEIGRITVGAQNTIFESKILKFLS